MATAKNIVAQIVLPTKRANPKGVAYTSTFENQPNVAISAQDYRSHLKDLFVDRQSQDSREILKDLLKFDADASAALHAYLTVADTEPRFLVYTQEGELDRAGQQQFDLLLQHLTQKNDYKLGFTFTKTLRETSENLRYALILRGSLAAELVFSKLLTPAEIRVVDVAELEWFEKSPGVYKPQQTPAGSSVEINLDIPNFFVKHYRQNPNEIYSEGLFVPAINTIAARQQVINDLYRIMQITGYPRMEISVLEEVLRKNAPANTRADESAMNTWLNARMTEIGQSFSNLRADSVYVHSDAVETKILNEKGPGSSMDVTDIISVLNSTNQAALKTMATVIGRGDKGVNTASVEARIFSLSAQCLNGPVADFYSEAFTLALRLSGYEGYVKCEFSPVELRPWTELEPQRVMQQQRLLTDLSHGIITDDEYHLEMYNRPRPDSAPELSGTNFMNPAQIEGASANASKVSPNSDPTGRAVTPSGSSSARSNTVKSGNK